MKQLLPFLYLFITFSACQEPDYANVLFGPKFYCDDLRYTEFEFNKYIINFSYTDLNNSGFSLVKQVGIAYSYKNNVPTIEENKEVVNLASFQNVDSFYGSGREYSDTLNFVDYDYQKVYIRPYLIDDQSTYYGEVISINLEKRVGWRNWQLPDINLKEFEYSSYCLALGIGDKVYYGLAAIQDYSSDFSRFDNRFWEFNTKNAEWSLLNPFPGEGRKGAVSFSINGKAYIGLGVSANQNYLQDFWVFDPSINNWKLLNDFPGEGRQNAFTFIINNKVYLGMGNDDYYTKNDFWEYDSFKDQWNQLQDLPYYINNYAFTGGEGYLVSGFSESNLYQYQPQVNEWLYLSESPIEKGINSFLVQTQDEIFVGSSKTIPGFFKYLISNNEWQLLDQPPYNGVRIIKYFSVSDFIYLITDRQGYSDIYITNPGTMMEYKH